MDNNFRFRQKHVLVTGAASGIGLEIARHFAREGAMLSMFDNNKQQLSLVANEFSGTTNALFTYAVDVSNRLQVESAVAPAKAKQPIDILNNNEGIAIQTPFLNIKEAEWRKVLDVNLTGMFFVAQCGLPEEIAPICLFLAGIESSFITDQVIIADGRQLAGQKAGNSMLCISLP